MTEIENKILKKVEEIKKILEQEGHTGEYFSLTINRQGIISFNNNYWENDEKIDYVDIVGLLKEN